MGRSPEKKSLYSFRTLLKRNPVMRRVFVALYTLTSSEKENAVSIKTLAQVTGVDYKAARRAVRTLARRGLAALYHALWTEDGRPAGSGYGITLEGEHMMDQVVDLVDAEMGELYDQLRMYA